MTSSDDDLAWRLRRELHAEAARLMPAQDGLSQIHAQLRSRSSAPWWGGLRVDAERYGLHLRHLAAEAADWVVVQTRRIPFPGRSRGEHDGARRPAGARPGLVWLRPVLALAAVCIFAGTAAAVPGLRHAITSMGSSGTGRTTSVTGHGGGSGYGTGQQAPNGNHPAGTHAGATATASPSPGPTCTNQAKPVPSVLATPTRGSSPEATPAVSPVSSPPVAAPTTAPASPTESPTTPTGSSDPTPTGTLGAPSGGGDGTTDSTHLAGTNPCHLPGPTPPGTASASSASASQLAPVIPVPTQTSAQVYKPAVTPTASPTPSASPSSSAPAGSATPSATSTSTSTGSGSPWSKGFTTARGCRRHPHPGC
ncbi:MAG TPA: hypothetical protein VGD68_14465 [Streptosporangiaceae bacterium]